MRLWLTALLMLACVGVGMAQGVPEPLSVVAERAQRLEKLTGELRQAEAGQREAGRALARARGWVEAGRDAKGRKFALRGVERGRPVYFTTFNENAAISSGASLVRQTAPYSVDGSGLVLGIWDGGSVRATHTEFAGGRVVAQDGAAVDNHATHVGGTMVASGVSLSARGMAPAATLHSHDWNSDTSEMASRAAAAAPATSAIPISNHSYGFITGWVNGSFSGSSGWHWFGDNHGTAREDANFGRYSSVSRAWDEVCAAAPWFLPFKAAGNDRNDGLPTTGGTYYFFDSQSGWTAAAYNATTSPLADGHDNGGFDTIGDSGVSKNVMTVGAVDDAVSGGARSLAGATMSSFSGWGPADDGRIKPDIVANGVSLFSTSSGGDASYMTMSGTSMATPSAAGSAALLQDLHVRRSGGFLMTASLLKALIIHTADDLGRPGPDYTFGWGLMNTKAAADVIESHFAAPAAQFLVTGTLAGVSDSRTYLVQWNGVEPLRATLCWTDPAGSEVTGLDNPAPALVNDLDLRVTAPGGGVFLPFRLNPAAPTQAAATGDNIVDTVESVVVAAPGTPGVYEITVSHKNGLGSSGQSFSLVVTGQSIDTMTVTPADEAVSTGEPGGPFAPGSHDFAVRNDGAGTLGWSVTDDADWLDLGVVGGALAPGGEGGVTASLNASALDLPNGTHTARITFMNTGSGFETTRIVRVVVGGDPLTEQFTGAGDAFDLANKTITFLPTGSGGYAAAVDQASSLPSPPGASLPNPPDDGAFLASPAWQNGFAFFGQSVASLYLNTNGSITFDGADFTWVETLAGHFGQRRVAMLFDDLNPSAGGSMHYSHLPGDRAVVTFQDVPEFGASTTNTFQAELFDDGSDIIRLTFLGMAAADGIVGLSEGGGEPDEFASKESNFSGDYGGLPVIGIEAEDAVAAEFAPPVDAAVLRLTNANPVNAPLTVRLVTSGTASPSDYSGLADTVVLPPGAVSLEIGVSAVADELSEGVEDVVVGVAAGGAAYSAGSPASARIELLDKPADQWRFDELGGNVPLAGDLEDFDFDGVQNLVEYALGMDPANPDASGLPRPASDGASLSLAVSPDPAKPDVSVTAESSTDLVTWSQSDVTWNGSAFVTPLDAPAKFMRLKVERKK